eukprot:TRINITY_DN50673_c0_g1_i1.p1 TRINITY_DN50673_c0_g1~~TRINITY_DN50673_c0_g1_i1.p1  ORF type:complete len:107 (-),score=21.73 TRINITY_DN50673_c0_g1_i1:28-348(-)
MRRAAQALQRQRPPPLKRVTFNNCTTKVFFVEDEQFTQVAFDMPNQQGGVNPRQKRRIPRLTDDAKQMLFGWVPIRKVSPLSPLQRLMQQSSSKSRSSKLASIVPV